MLQIKELRKIYKGTSKGIQNLDLTISRGDICAFIGSNGAGKSTSLKSIAGIHPFDSGTVLLDKIDLVKNPQDFKMNLGYSPDNPDIYENLRGYEYLNFIGSMYEVSSDDFSKRLELLSELLDMKNALSKSISTYSHGMKQRLVLISLFMHNPKLIILDEPFVGLDPNATHFLIDELKKRAANGTMVIYSTHVLEVAEKLCNHVVLIDDGQVKVNDKMSTVTQKESLNEVFRRVTKHE